MRVLLVVNPFSSSVTRRTQVLVGKALAADHEVTVAETRRRDHATRLAEAATHDGTEVVVVLGGDGTLNEVANGLAGSDTALAPLPGGSTNVFARTIGLPDDPLDATLAISEAISEGRIHRRGTGTVNGRHFLFHTGVGFDAAVVGQVERRAQWKRWGGHVWFVAAAVDTFFRHFDRSGPAMRVTHSNGRVEDAAMTVVFNSSPYTYLGTRPLDVAPDARLDKPLVAISITSVTLPALLGVAARALKGGGSLEGVKGVSYTSDVDEITISGVGGPVEHQVDGDHLGGADLLVFRHAPDSIRLVLPEVPSAV